MKNNIIGYVMLGTRLVLIACLAWKKRRKNETGEPDLFYFRRESHPDFYGEYTL